MVIFTLLAYKSSSIISVRSEVLPRQMPPITLVSQARKAKELRIKMAKETELREKALQEKAKELQAKKELQKIERKIASDKRETKLRVAHAHELLGRHYKKSIVKVGENVLDIRSFIHLKLEDELQGPTIKKIKSIERTLITQSKLYRFDPIFLMAVIETESSFDPNIVGSFGEIGLMQIRAETAQWIAKKYGIRWTNSRKLKDPSYNITIGAAYLDFLRGRFEFQSRLYIAAYNMGQTNVHRALDREIWPKEYPFRVMQHYIQDYALLSDTFHKTQPKARNERELLVGNLRPVSP